MSDVVNTARDSDLAIGSDDALDESVAIIALYSDPSTLTPTFVNNPEKIVRGYSDANRVPLGQALNMYQEGLKALCTAERTRVNNGRVSLNLDGTYQGRTWSVPGADGDPEPDARLRAKVTCDHSEVIPQVVFASLSIDSAMYVPGECEAIAVHYLPDTQVVTKIRQRDGVAYFTSNDWLTAGYLGVARTFASLNDATDARDELVDAVKAIGRPPESALTSDGLSETVSERKPVMPSII